MEVTHYDNGRPSWADVTLADPAAGVSFYTELFAWEAQDMGEAMGHYTIFSKNGKPVAGLNGMSGPANWTTYFNVADLEDVTERIEPAGGTVLVGPTTVGTAGRMAVFTDSTGAPFAAWQAGDHIGAALRNESGAFISSELGSSDVAKSKAFYTAVLDWDWGGKETYPEGVVNGRFVAGVMPPDQFDKHGRPHGPDYWLVCFDSCVVDADVAKARSMGATVLCEPFTNINGKQYAILADPQGAAFAIYDY